MIKEYATKKELNNIEKPSLDNYATKDDLKNIEKPSLDNYATKDDLNNIDPPNLDNYATKDDLNNIENPNLDNYATKVDLNKTKQTTSWLTGMIAAMEKEKPNLENYATKHQLDDYAHKDELNDTLKNYAKKNEMAAMDKKHYEREGTLRTERAYDRRRLDKYDEKFAKIESLDFVPNNELDKSNNKFATKIGSDEKYAQKAQLNDYARQAQLSQYTTQDQLHDYATIDHVDELLHNENGTAKYVGIGIWQKIMEEKAAEEARINQLNQDQLKDYVNRSDFKSELLDYTKETDFNQLNESLKDTYLAQEADLLNLRDQNKAMADGVTNLGDLVGEQLLTESRKMNTQIDNVYNDLNILQQDMFNSIDFSSSIPKCINPDPTQNDSSYNYCSDNIKKSFNTKLNEFGVISDSNGSTTRGSTTMGSTTRA